MTKKPQIKIPWYIMVLLKISKKFNKDKILAKRLHWTIDYGFGIIKAHFHTPYGDVYLEDY